MQGENLPPGASVEAACSPIRVFGGFKEFVLC